MTNMVVADEVAAHIEPRRAMAVLMNVGKPLQTSDNIFMTEWVAIFRARELQVDQQVERAYQPLSAKTAVPTTKPNPKSSLGLPILSQTRWMQEWRQLPVCPPRARMGSAYGVVLSLTISRLVPAA